MMKLQIAKDLALPIRAVTEKMAFLGRTGSGKTYAASKMAEEMHAAGAQIVVLEPVGTWYGLRLNEDGHSPGIAIPVFGGLHGDVPLDPSKGAMVADLVVDRGISLICDVSQFEHDTEKARFAKDFATRFFYRKKAAPSAVHVFIEECQEFLPQQPAKGEEQMLHAFQRMWKLGRNFGIGGSLISQRPQEVSKKALNLSEVVFAFQLTGPHERKALEGWIAEKGLNEDIGALLPKLAIGEARVWSPGWLKISETVKILPKSTFNASATPEVGARLKVRDLAPIDLERIRQDMAETIERARADDPRELRKRITELEKAAKKPAASLAPADPSTAKAVNKETLEKARAEGANSVRKILARELKKYEASVMKKINQTRTMAEQVAADLIDTRFDPLPSLEGIIEEVSKPAPAAAARPTPVAREPYQRPVRSAPPRQSAGGNGDMKLPVGERAVLIVCAQYPGGADKKQISILTSYKRSTRDAYIQRLREKGFVNDSGAVVEITQDGMNSLGPDFEPLPTGQALQEYWLDKLPEGEAKILELLIAVSGKPIERDTLDSQTGYARSSRDAYLQRLKARQLVEIVSRGEVRASEVLFE